MMTGRAKRNLSLARQRRTEKARAAYTQARAELERIADRETMGHKSDCAVHGGPALEPGPCDCGVELAKDISYFSSVYGVFTPITVRSDTVIDATDIADRLKEMTGAQKAP